MLPVTLALATTMACEVDRTLVCDSKSDCVRDEVEGSCVAPGYCAFTDSECDSNLRWDSTAQEGFATRCVEAESSTPNACGGVGILSGTLDAPCGVCNSGTLECESTEALKCVGELSLENVVTTEGSVTASSVFSGSFPASKAVDLDESSSWFSAGPEGAPTEFTWTGTRDDCFTHVKLVGNGGHSNSSFRTDFGFGTAVIQVLGDNDEAVFSESVDLSGTPDPTIDLDLDAQGRKVRLLLSGHESDDCGGFGEIYITATR